ncbi:hypothetical protein ACIP1T_27525 [Pseudomonas japonica]|uniref:hypothetical protein n=1 Tax=Pseudomonas japonica TaxID=256466 RepID=UPI003815EBEF
MKHSLLANDLARLAIKIALSRLGIMLLSIIDMTMLSYYSFISVGVSAVANSILQVWVVVSGSIFVGYYARDQFSKETAGEEDVHLALPLALALGAIAMCLSLCTALLQDDSTLRTLVIIGSLGFPALFVFTLCVAQLETSGRAGTVVRITLCSLVANSLLNLVFIKFSDSAAEAVMWATSCVRVIAMILALFYVRKALTGGFRRFSSRWSFFLLKTGLPEAGGRALFVILLAMIMIFSSRVLAPLEMSEVAISLMLLSVLTLSMMSVSMAAATLVNVDRKQGIWTFLNIGFVGLGCVMAVYFLCVLLYVWIVDKGSSSLLVWCGLAGLFDAVSGHLVMALRKGGDSKFPPFIKMAMFPVFLGLCFYLEFATANDFVFNLAVANCGAMILAAIYAGVRIEGWGKPVITPTS